MKVFIITEGGATIGFGHITRCISLSDAFLERGVSPLFIINGDDSVPELLSGKGCEVFDWLKEPEKLFEMIRDADVAFIDSYLAGEKLYREISRITGLSACIDDTVRLRYPAGIVVNGAISAETFHYSKDHDVTYLLGSRYTPLRREFWDMPEKEIKPEVESVLITFGGEDLRNMVPPVLRLLAERHPVLKKRVVIGRGFSNRREIEDAADGSTELLSQLDAAGMRDVMLQSDIAISAGGQTLYELTRIGVPTIAVAVADNQEYNIRGCRDKGLIEPAGWWNDGEVMDGILSCMNRLRSFSARKEMSQRGRLEVDGQGARRIVEKTLSLIRRG